MTPPGVLEVRPPAPEWDIARDLVRRGLFAMPIAIAGGALVWGVHGAISAGAGLFLVLVNFLLAAAVMAWAASISPNALMGAVLGSYVLRLALLFVAVLLVGGRSWFVPIPFSITLIAGHLLLLISETRHVSATLAYPALKPRPAVARKLGDQGVRTPGGHDRA